MPLRRELEGLTPYGAPQLDVQIRLNVNENPYSPSEETASDIAAAVRDAALGLNRYPDRDFPALRQALASYVHQESQVLIRPENIWAANGSNEVMLHLFQAYGGPTHKALAFTPAYSMYPEYARDTCTEFVVVPRMSDFRVDLDMAKEAIVEHKPALVLITSPNNPTGTAMPLSDIREITQMARGNGPQKSAGDHTDAVVIVDEAYAEFRRAGTPSAMVLLEEYPNMVVSRTMSKAFGMAGLRLGYMAASQQIIDNLMVVRLPYHLSAVTQAAALAALAHTEELRAQVAGLAKQRDQLVVDLRAMGLEAIDSDANFVMFGTFADRSRVWKDLLDRGVLIREVGPPGWLRVSIGTVEETAAFLAALREVLANERA